MKKKTLVCALIILTLGTTMIGCNNSKNNEKKSSTNSEKISSEKADKESSSNKDNTDKKSNDKEGTSNKDKTGNKSETTNNNTNNSSSTENKTTYLNKLDDIKSGLSDLDSYYAGNTAEMKYAANEEYKRWDNALNEIYNKLKETLPKDEFIELQKEEISWIAQKEKDAQAAGKEYEGGTAQGLAYSSSLAKSTKDRCYELVNKYM